MKKLFFSICRSKFVMICIIAMTMFFMFSMTCGAQNVVQNGKTFIVQESDSSSKGKATKTEYTYQDKTGTYPIYLSANGSAFIFKVSKKSGKEYRKYLPEVTKKLGTKKDKDNAK
jgi:hypothetical protein